MINGVAEQVRSLDEAGLHNARLLRDACLRVAHARGTRVIWTHDELPEGVFGLFTDDPVPQDRAILIRSGLDPVWEAVTLSHEIAHLCDPGLNHYAQAHYYSIGEATYEAIAYYASFIAVEAYGLLPYLPDGWFETMIGSHYDIGALLGNDRLVDRADRAVLKLLYPEAARRLQDQRAAEGRPMSGRSTGAKLIGRLRRLRDASRAPAAVSA